MRTTNIWHLSDFSPDLISHLPLMGKKSLSFGLYFLSWLQSHLSHCRHKCKSIIQPAWDASIVWRGEYWMLARWYCFSLNLIPSLVCSNFVLISSLRFIIGPFRGFWSWLFCSVGREGKRVHCQLFPGFATFGASREVFGFCEIPD